MSSKVKKKIETVNEDCSDGTGIFWGNLWVSKILLPSGVEQFTRRIVIKELHGDEVANMRFCILDSVIEVINEKC